MFRNFGLYQYRIDRFLGHSNFSNFSDVSNYSEYIGYSNFPEYSNFSDYFDFFRLFRNFEFFRFFGLFQFFGLFDYRIIPFSVHSQSLILGLFRFFGLFRFSNYFDNISVDPILRIVTFSSEILSAVSSSWSFSSDRRGRGLPTEI